MFTAEFLSNALSPDKAAVQEVLNRLTARYLEPKESRYYHTLGHINYGLKVYKELFTIPLTPVKFFAWAFHDSVYDSRMSDNEQRSADLLMREAPVLGLSMDESDEAGKYIIATHPSAEPINIINDIDLAILGSEPEAYNMYVEHIRKEYSWVEPEVWKAGRTGVLRQLLKRERLYISPEFDARFSAQAIENMKLELLSL